MDAILFPGGTIEPREAGEFEKEDEDGKKTGVMVPYGPGVRWTFKGRKGTVPSAVALAMVEALAENPDLSIFCDQHKLEV